MHKLKMDKPNFNVIDTLEYSRAYLKDDKNQKLPSYKLEELKKHFKLKQYKSRNALDDCYVTGVVYIKCKEAAFNKVKDLSTKLEYLKTLENRHRLTIHKLLDNTISLKEKKNQRLR